MSNIILIGKEIKILLNVTIARGGNYTVEARFSPNFMSRFPMGRFETTDLSAEEKIALLIMNDLKVALRPRTIPTPTMGSQNDHEAKVWEQKTCVACDGKGKIKI